jgi:hypothetical protein
MAGEQLRTWEIGQSGNLVSEKDDFRRSATEAP